MNQSNEMKGFLIIGAMFWSGNVMLILGFGSLSWDAIQIPLTLLGLAAVLVLSAWVAAMCKAIGDGQRLWFFALAFLPTSTPAMWCYLLWNIGSGLLKLSLRNPSAKHYPPYSAYPPGPPPYPSYPAYDLNEPLGLRQAVAVVEEAERRYPEW
jgi:hypothetical protein